MENLQKREHRKTTEGCTGEFRKDYTMVQIAELMQVSAQTIRREIKRGKLKAHPVGHQIRISEEALADYRRLKMDELERSHFDIIAAPKQVKLTPHIAPYKLQRQRRSGAE